MNEEEALHSSERQPIGASLLAREIRTLPGAARRTLGVTEEAIAIWDAIISFFALMVNDEDGRPWQERLGATIAAIPGVITNGDLDTAALEKWTSEFQNVVSNDLPKWSKDLERDGAKRFLLRLLGAAAYRRCLKGLQHDTGIATVAMRRATRALFPYVAALDDLYGVLPPEARGRIAGGPDKQVVLLELALKLDETFSEKATEWSLPLAKSGARVNELVDLKGTDARQLALQMREIISGRTRKSVDELDATLARKIQGARHALRNSPDPVAQAANSLIELLDRILRAAFDDEEVLSWARRNYSDLPDMEYAPDPVKPQNLKPTKKAQALCLLHGGTDVSEPSVLHELAALAITASRRELQKIKHADKGGTPEELAAIENHLAGIEAYLLFAIELAWAAVPTERVERFHQRLSS